MSVAEVVDQALEVTRYGWADARDDPPGVTRTFLFADIVGSTRLVDAIGDAAWVHVLGWHECALAEVWQRHGGDLVDQAGDCFFVCFDDPRAAIDCAVAIQRMLAYHRQEHGFALELRIGVHRARVLRAGGAFRGKGVHVAARIAALAGGGEILASSATLRAARSDASASVPQPVQLDGLSELVDVQRIAWASPSGSATETDAGSQGERRKMYLNGRVSL
jgi:class 3 adenylate cyclase